MDKKYSSHNRLRWLAGITAAALFGIVALQAYWLRTSYKEQQSRFRADIENALTGTLIKTQLMAAMSAAKDTTATGQMQEGMADLLTSLIGQVPRAPRHKSSRLINSVTLNVEDSTSPAVNALRKLMQASDSSIRDNTKVKVDFTGDEPDTSHIVIELAGVKATLEKELRKRDVWTPAEIAMADSEGHIYRATCDTGAFRRIPVRSALTDAQYSFSGNMRLQAAFPDANIFLLRRMAWILSVTALLILLGGISFAWLMWLFFRQKKLADIRNDFLNNMTHELKTPISSVSVALELIQDTRYPVSDETKQEYFSIAQGELKRLTMLVEKVLKMAAFEKSEISINPETFLGAAWLQTIITSLRPVFEVADAQVTTNVQPELLMLYADKTHLTNVLQNLLENALKYNGTPTPRIHISIQEETASAAIKVSDNGKGIPAAYLGKVFDKFFRVPTGDRHDTKGYGLGLSYVKAIAELHGGSIEVNSNPGVETSFIVRIPKQSAL